MNVTRTGLAALLLALLASMLSDPAAARYSIAFGESARSAAGASGDYRFAARMRAEWFELVREIPLGSALSLGLGVHVGGPEIELRTVASSGAGAGRDADRNRWLALDARIEFHDLQPYVRLRYRAGRNDRGFGMQVDAGLRVLKVEDLSIRLDGPLATDIGDRERRLDELERESRERLDDYYAEPVFQLAMNYRFD